MRVPPTKDKSKSKTFDFPERRNGREVGGRLQKRAAQQGVS